MFRSAPLSFSKLDCLKTCGRRFECKYIEKLPDPSGEPAETGTGFHAWSDDATGVEDELALVRLLEAKAVLLVDGPARDLRDLVHRYLNAGGLPRIPADATDVRHEAEVAIRADGSACGYWDQDALFRGRLDQSWLESEGTLAVVRDWKTSRVIVQVGEQLRLYAALLAALHPNVLEVVAELHFVRFGSVRKEVFDAEELRAVVPDSLAAAAVEIDRRVQEHDLKPRIGEHCRSCAYQQHCPPMRKFHPYLAIEDEGSAREAADNLLALEVQVAATKKALRAWTLRNGPLVLHSGEVIDHHPSTSREITDARAAAAALRQAGVSPGEIWDALTLPVTAAERAIKTLPEVSGARRGQKGAAVARVLGMLTEAGALTTTTTTTFRRKKPGAEELAPEPNLNTEENL